MACDSHHVIINGCDEKEYFHYTPIIISLEDAQLEMCVRKSPILSLANLN